MTRIKTQALLLACGLMALGSAVPASASVNLINTAPAANSTYSLVEDALLQFEPGDTSWNGRRVQFSAQYSWVNDPMVDMNPSRTQKLSTVVDGISALDLSLNWFAQPRMELGFGMPFSLVHLPGQAEQFSLGDSRIFMKYRFSPDDALVAFSVMPELRLPTGAQDLFLSDGSVGGGLSFSAERDFGLIRAAANLGYRFMPNARYADLNYTQKLPVGLAVYAPINDQFSVTGEAAGAMTLPLNRFNNPGELYSGLRYRMSRGAIASGGISIGGLDSNGAADFKVLFGLKFTPNPDNPAPAPVFTPVVQAPVFPTLPAVPRVVFTPKEIQINEEIKFEHASAVLTHSGRELLDEVAAVIKKNRKRFRTIIIEGHTNELGSYEYNQKLSEDRASSVREYLASRGISPKLLVGIGYGKTKPKNLGKLPKQVQLAANRRVQFKIVN